MERLRGERFETFRQATDKAIAQPLWYNRIPMHSMLNYIGSIEFEQNWNGALKAVPT